MNPAIQTSRLILRERTKELFEETLKKPLEFQLKFFGLVSEEHLKEKLDQWSKAWETSLTFDIILKETNTVIGYIGFYRWFKEHFRSEIGYYLHEEHRRKGLTEEAARRILEYGFEDLNLHRIEALTSPNNIPSRSLVEKLQFKEEGLLRQHYYDNGSFSNSVMYSLLKKEWHKQ